MKFSKNTLTKILAAVFVLACAFATISSPSAFAADPEPSTNSADVCPQGTVQAGLQLKQEVTLKKSNGESSSKTGTISSLAQCNLDADALDKDNKNNSLTSMINLIINVVLGVLGIVAVIVIIVGGFTYMTSNGDPAKTTKGRNIILYGIIGLVVALLAFAIVNFVLNGIWG